MQYLIQFIQHRSEVLFRVMLSLIFIVAGGNHLFATSAVSTRLQNSDLSSWLTAYFSPDLLVVLAGLTLMVGGLALLLGFQSRRAALLLLLTIIPITVVIQLQGMHTLGPLFKNVGLMGGLIHFGANGSTNYALDNVLCQTKF